MMNISKDRRLSVEEKFDGEACAGEDRLSYPKSKTAAPEKVKLLSKQEPEGLARLRVKYAKREDNNLVKAVRAKCLDCCCGSTKEVAECPSANCALWKFRFGCQPLPRETSEEQREKMRERAKKNFSKKSGNDNSPTTNLLQPHNGNVSENEAAEVNHSTECMSTLSTTKLLNDERILFNLNNGWALGYNPHQWIIYKGNFKQDTASSVPRSFVATTKDILLRVIRELGISPTPEAQERLDDLPETFKQFIRSIETLSKGKLAEQHEEIGEIGERNFAKEAGNDNSSENKTSQSTKRKLGS